MKVKELRSWLSDIGEKQKLQNVRSKERPSLASKDKLQTFRKIEQKTSKDETSPPSSHDATSPKAQLHDHQAGFSPNSEEKEHTADTPACSPVHYLSSLKAPKAFDSFDDEGLDLKKNPSVDPTVATRDDSIGTISETPKPAASWDSSLVNGGSWDNAEFTDPEPIFEFSPSSSFEDSSNDSLQHASLRPDDYCIRGYSDRGIGGLRDMGKLHVALLKKQGPTFVSAKQVDEDEGAIQGENEEQSKARNMHSANIFGNKTLTAGTLDLICNDGKAKTMYSLPKNTTVGLDDDETSSSLSNDSSSKPSIVPGALDSKMAQLLLDPHPLNEGVRREMGYRRAPRTIPRCKKIDPKDLAFLNQANKKYPGTDDHIRPSSVASGIEKFGGPRKTIVERRKEELEKIWEERKAVVHVKKVKWGVCQRTGMYKKKIVIDVHKK